MPSTQKREISAKFERIEQAAAEHNKKGVVFYTIPLKINNNKQIRWI